MSDALTQRPSTPFPAEEPPEVSRAAVDPLAGDWSEGLRGPLRALGIPAPRSVLEARSPERGDGSAGHPAHQTEEVEAPDGWASGEDPLVSEPPPVAPSFPDTTPPSPAPAFDAGTDLAAASPGPAHEAAAPLPAELVAASPPPIFGEITPSFPDLTPSSPAPAFDAAAHEGVVELDAREAAESHEETVLELGAEDAAEPVVELGAQDEEGDPIPWEHALAAAGEPVAAGEPHLPPVAEAAAEPAPAPRWDLVTAISAAPSMVVAEEPPAAWGAAPAAIEPEQWKGPAASDDWEAIKKPAPHERSEAPAADWGALSATPDWTAPAASGPADDGGWGAPPPAAASSPWGTPAAASGAESDWAPAAPSTSRQSAAAWQSAPMGASTLEQLDSDFEAAAPAPGAAQALFGSVPAGGSLGGEEPEELSSPAHEPVPSEDADLLVPIDEPVPPPAPRTRLAQMAPVAAIGSLGVSGEHRVAVHTRGGRTRRGTVRDVDLSKSQFDLSPQGGGASEAVYHAEVKAIFFMLGPGEKPTPGGGARVKVTFADGRAIEGERDGSEGKHGFFLVPADAARTNTRRIYVAREATTEIKDT